MSKAESLPQITSIFSYLVHPGKHESKQLAIKGTAVPFKGKLYEVLGELFVKTDGECNLDIVFKPNDKGEQQNDCRDSLLTFRASPTVATGKKLAERLQSVTTRRSGLGLLFLIVGTCDAGEKIIVSRFPADSGILADENSATLTVEFVEKIFLKNARAYKTVVYSGDNDDGDFWSGKAIDRQIDDVAFGSSAYWVEEFLESALATTSHNGTMRLATAFNEALRSTSDQDLKREIVAACTLLPGLGRKSLSIQAVCKRLALSDPATKLIQSQLKSGALFTDRFTISTDVLKKTLAFRSEELSNGAILTAKTTDFDNVFEQKLDKKTEEVTYTTKGKVVDRKIRKGKA